MEPFYQVTPANASGSLFYAMQQKLTALVAGAAAGAAGATPHSGQGKARGGQAAAAAGSMRPRTRGAAAKNDKNDKKRQKLM
jgi:type IV secretory pathway VirB6-like protein